MVKIIGIVSGKGGVGKTTAAINLAATLNSNFNKNVVVVDCNVTTPHVGLSLGLVHDSLSTLNEVLLGKRKIEEAMHTFSPGFSIVPASLSVHDLKGIEIGKLGESLKEKFDDYDYVFLDSAAGLGREGVSTMLASDELILVATPYLISMSDIIRAKQIANEMKKDTLGIIVNMKHEKHNELTEKQIESFTQLPVLGVIQYDKEILASLIAKQPIVFRDGRSKTSKEFVKIARTISGEEYIEEDGWLSRLTNLFSKAFKW